MKKHLLSFLAPLLLLCPQTFGAEFAAADIFSPGLVLQRDRPIPVWGIAPDGTEVTVSFADISSTGSSSGGKWRVDLPALKASATPRSMKILFKGGEEITIDNIVVGEVWLCAGQSNMAQRISKNPPRELAEMPLVRQFAKGRGKDSANPPRWTAAVGDDLALMSVTAVYFAENLHRELNVPVGLILTAVSGTPIESWIPKAALEADAGTKALLDQAADREVRQRITAAKRKMRDDVDVALDPELLKLGTLESPGSLFAMHIAPVVPFALRGVIWYQGEANSNVSENAKIYGKYLAMLIASLRSAFGQPDLPFYAVQLPSIGEHRGETRVARSYEIVREQQRRTIQATPHTGLAVSIDVNEGLHPKHKNIMGDRLAGIALVEAYGQKAQGAFTGPLLEQVRFQDGQAVCSFVHSEGGLVLKDAGPGLFEISGADGVFRPATATVDEGKLIVRSDSVGDPRSVRYAFQPSLEKVSLFGSSGLPASPFVFP